jgi:hypothetical protein
MIRGDLQELIIRANMIVLQGNTKLAHLIHIWHNLRREIVIHAGLQELIIRAQMIIAQEIMIRVLVHQQGIVEHVHLICQKKSP